MISVIIPVYNQAEYLADCLSSIVNQTKMPKEVIVINDGSTDKSLEIAETYPFRIINQVNKGLASARNTGIMNAKGRYILPLDADDMLYETAIEKIEKVINKTNADIVAPSFKKFGIDNSLVILDDDLEAKSFRENNRIGYFSAFRKSLAQKVGGYSPRMTWGYEDYAFWIDLLKRGATLEVIKEPLVLYRTKKESMLTEAVKHHGELIAQIKKDHYEIYT